jgi:hypothetical protein
MKSARDQIEDGANVWQADYFRHSWRFTLCAFHKDENTHNRRPPPTAPQQIDKHRKKGWLGDDVRISKIQIIISVLAALYLIWAIVTLYR